MKLFLTNDDGINSAGLKALAEVLNNNDNYVTVVAPSEQRSGMSHSIISGKDGVNYTKIDLIKNVDAYSCTGTPADCVKFGLMEINKGKDIPDILVSGINDGTNLGNDVLYSGTIAAAMEGALNGIRSIAISTSKSGYEDRIMEISRFILNFISTFDFNLIPKSTVININYPKSNPLGIKVVPYLSKNAGHTYSKKDNTSNYFLKYNPDINDRENDIYFYNLGFITVTPLLLDRNDFKCIDSLSEFKFSIGNKI